VGGRGGRREMGQEEEHAVGRAVLVCGGGEGSGRKGEGRGVGVGGRKGRKVEK